MSGGPLRSIADDDSRSASERALAEALISFMQQRQSLHAKPLPLPIGIPLSFAQVKLLFHLPGDGGSLPLGRYADLIGITPAALTQALGHVEELGLVKRERSSTDKRIVEARITDAGRTVLDQLRLRFNERWNTNLAQFTEDEFDAAARVLTQATAMFKI